MFCGYAAHKKNENIDPSQLTKMNQVNFSVNSAAQQMAQTFLPLALENRPAVPTQQAAFYMHRKPQTLRKWATYDGTGPIRAFRCNGRLLWPLDQIRAALGVVQNGSNA